MRLLERQIAAEGGWLRWAVVRPSRLVVRARAGLLAFMG
jgi:hypothetical protein